MVLAVVVVTGGVVTGAGVRAPPAVAGVVTGVGAAPGVLGAAGPGVAGVAGVAGVVGVVGVVTEF